MKVLKKNRILCSVPVFLILVFPVLASEKPDAQQIFKQNCFLCHGIDKKKLGPAVKTMSRDADVLREIISKGKKPMPAYKGKLTDEEISALVGFLLARQ